jgi:hypothetical protein
MGKKPSEYMQIKKMLKNINLIKEGRGNVLMEQNDPTYKNNLNQDPAANQQNGDEHSEQYNVDAEQLVLSSASGQPIELTDDVRNSFTTTIDEFKQQVSDLVDFNSLQVRDNEVQWSGRLTKFDLEFFYVLGANNGVYLRGDKIKVDEELTTLLGQLTQYFNSFSQKWSSVLTSRQQGKQNNEPI